jgi:hypothetical protein
MPKSATADHGEKVMFKHCSILFAVLVVFVAACESKVQPHAEESAVDLSAWQKVGDNPWRFTDAGANAGPAEAMGYLVSNDDYEDFSLSVEYWVEDNTNSGIFVRCMDRQEIGPGSCYEINIWDSHPNQASRTGSIVEFLEPLVHVDTLERWVRVEVEAIGSRIRASFDGQLTAELVDERSSSGVIALQYGGTGTLKFRNLNIESHQHSR